jgi:sec-independent protein translocase protein TatA
MNVGAPEMLIVLAVFVLLFGASRLPSLGRSMGQSITNFRKGMAEAREDDTKTAPQEPQQLSTSTPQAPPAAPVHTEQQSTTPQQ